MKRWALAGGLVAVALLVLVVGVVVLFSNVACAGVTVERAGGASGPTPEPGVGGGVVLDEAKVRAEAPRLAALLDAAVEEGVAHEGDERAARAMQAYLRDATGGHPRAVEWRGVPLHVLFVVC